jgi:hypothetical protein
MSFFATAEHEKKRLQEFASPEGRDDLYQYNQKESRTVLEVSTFALNILQLSCNTCLSVQNNFGNNMHFCPSVDFHGLEVTGGCGLVLFFRC